MGGAKNEWMGVRFEGIEEAPQKKRGLCARIRDRIRGGRAGRGFGKKKGEEGPAPFVVAEPVVAGQREMEPVVFFPGAGHKTAERQAPVLAELGQEAERFLDSFPEGPRRNRALAAVECVRKGGNEVLWVDDAVEAIVGYRERLDEPRGALFVVTFEGRTPEFIDKPVLRNAETLNVLFAAMGHFCRIINMIKKSRTEEGDEERARGEDRVEALRGIEKVLFTVPAKDRFGALGAIAEVAEAMGRGMCSKEVCRRLAALPYEIRGREAMAALEEVARGLRPAEAPSGTGAEAAAPGGAGAQENATQNAEPLKPGMWMESRAGEARNIARMVWENGKPQSLVEFMWMLERHQGDADTEREKRHFVMEEAVNELAGPAGFSIVEGAGGLMEERVAWNVAYFCLPEICMVTGLAEGLKDEEELRRSALKAIVDIAVRMPEGRRMEAPWLVLKGVDGLMRAGKPAPWVVSDWLAELGNCIASKTGERAYARVVWLSENPMKVFE